uniref:Uncharacterized protein n=1 Tax=Arundo donax TaxID=35708 RepID=A0A0A8ZQX1_ARUDO
MNSWFHFPGRTITMQVKVHVHVLNPHDPEKRRRWCLARNPILSKCCVNCLKLEPSA